MKDLKPCPFCGSNPELERDFSKGNVLKKYRCSNKECPSRLGPRWGYEDKAAQDWNTRSPELFPKWKQLAKRAGKAEAERDWLASMLAIETLGDIDAILKEAKEEAEKAARLKKTWAAEEAAR